MQIHLDISHDNVEPKCYKTVKHGQTSTGSWTIIPITIWYQAFGLIRLKDVFYLGLTAFLTHSD